MTTWDKENRQIPSYKEAKEALREAIAGTSFELDTKSQEWFMRAVGSKLLEDLSSEEFDQVSDIAMTTLDKQHAETLGRTYFNTAEESSPGNFIFRMQKSPLIENPKWQEAIIRASEGRRDKTAAERSGNIPEPRPKAAVAPVSKARRI